ncbi:MAG: bifunctional hydroxymethylpyrimidine kinase/phosphomethylpyrimidine kinase [Treponema lecithinolyticum]|uniref:bifunctional hydroxymethylpyrimidine kinase/phosphomethylpyrimidine kinase n=1 Tax=Treponema lecithinolyticum TaxID=53418 RepID=UPI0036155998
MIKAATIAGSDASGGAGLEADLKTFEEYGLYGMTVVTLVATMDPNNNWAHSVFPLAQDVLRCQMETVFKGVGVDALKTGMLGTDYAVSLSKEYIISCGIKNYVLDPVMVCKGAGEALNPELNAAVEKELLPLCKVVTPNLFEAGQLAGIGEIKTVAQMEEAARIIADKGAQNVFIKGGSKLASYTGSSSAIDLFYDGTTMEHIDGPLVKTSWTHGAGCTTAAAVTAGLARGLSAREAVLLAKKFIGSSLQASFALNQWVGPGNPSAWRNSTLFK